MDKRQRDIAIMLFGAFSQVVSSINAFGELRGQSMGELAPKVEELFDRLGSSFNSQQDRVLETLEQLAKELGIKT